MGNERRTSRGWPFPLGATVTTEGINFAVFSRHGSAVYLELFDAPDDARSRLSLQLDPQRNRTGDVWHIFVHGARHGQLYGYRVDGQYTPEETGDRFNVHKLLTDPYARALAGDYQTDCDALFGFDRHDPREDLSFSTEDSAAAIAKSVAIAAQPYDWQEDRPPRVPLADSVLYEVHLRGLTIHPSSAVAHAGTYLGLIEKIPHLVQLGITAVELLPVQEFNRKEPNGVDPTTGEALGNYWGYSTLGFFAPEQDYAWGRGRDVLAEVVEFKEMVRHLHAAGIEVILDVVFNHTGEGDHRGPHLSFRGLDNSVYYLLRDNRHYANYSGCGNTVNCNHPVVKQLIIDCLRYWVVEMHVDGFRFDLATILGRDRKGAWIGDLGLLYDIGGDPILRGCKLIAEAWDAEGMYKVGGFPEVWAEWNGRFRDDVRRFVRGDRGMVPQLARRLGGSHDLFASKRTPTQSINFITAHDGFTLRDLVSYDRKHNERNGEENRDGSNENFSSGYGAEGETDDAQIRELRCRQAKNLLTILMVSRGTPMLLGGDELWRTQQGNNNGYCQDNTLSWFDWSANDQSKEMQRFVRLLIALRRQHPALRRPCFVDPFAFGEGAPRQVGNEIQWHGVTLRRPDWSHHSRSLALQIEGRAPRGAPGSDDQEIYIACNAWREPLAFELPRLQGQRRWHRAIDTAQPCPSDIVARGAEIAVADPERYLVAPHSAVLLLGY